MLAKNFKIIFPLKKDSGFLSFANLISVNM